jgi:hypothetical protein
VACGTTLRTRAGNHDDRARCAQDLIDAARSSFFTSQPHLAIAKLTSSLEERSQRTLENAQGLVQRVAQSLGR